MEKSDKLKQLNERELERQLDCQVRKVAKASNVAENESFDYFHLCFKEKESEVLNALNLASNVSKEELPARFDAISKQIMALQGFVASNNLFLRNYDIKIYKESIQEMQNKLKETESQLIPKKKFGFKNKRTESKPLNTSDKIDSVIKEIKENKTVVIEKFFGLRNESNKTFILKDVLKKDVALCNLSECIVKVQGAPSTLHISKLSNCKVFTGPISTSIFIDDCFNCTFVISCQQLRLHSSKNICIYLHVTSRAIMEDCTDIKIAPYCWTYEGIDEDYATANLNREINNWQCIDDFNWLSAEKCSPNWRVLDPLERTISCNDENVL